MIGPAVRNPARPVMGVLLVLFIVFFFALADALTKLLVARHPVQVVIAGRFLSSLLLLLVFLARRLGRRLWATRRPLIVTVRSVCITVGALMVGLALQRMPIGETVAIVYCAPLLVMLLAAPILGEKVGAAGWASASLGLMGVMFIVRPGSGLDTLGVIFCLVNVALYAAYQLLTRKLSDTESSIALTANLCLVGAILFGVAAIPYLRENVPSLDDLALMSALGALSTLGHILYSVAFRLAPASLVAPASYFHLVWAALLGWVVFNELPDKFALIGMGMIMISGISTILLASLRDRP
ncbi:DMT family transporter [Mesorhizobium sp. M7A.F.Ca.US.006.01.1.1]|uniref:DMT family transporter n=1 Tax=Mesorhizobium sp. M7A.F.Ca.US.006.01.1.1 TaxID=2496707 RepID=UPI0013E2CCC5|nr:DMT family transporter [Mesorhizobium sp. M7A.F.Ca.US.006.01.1.1]